MPVMSWNERDRHNWLVRCGFLLSLFAEPPADASSCL
jgi:hypothetical protein